jgi:hypothetical protein
MTIFRAMNAHLTLSGFSGGNVATARVRALRKLIAG